jgi:hypothetical protein
MKDILRLKTIFLFCCLALLMVATQGISALGPAPKKELKYRSSFGKCPSRTAGNLALKLVKRFEENYSLKDVKNELIEENLIEKHFISKYRIKYDPLQKLLTFKFECPEPLMKAQIYKEEGLESYEAILVDNGQLYDPTYEVLLRGEKKLLRDLPSLALPVGEMDEKIQYELTTLVKSMGPDFRKLLSEVILDDDKNLTIILSVIGHPSSVFLGKVEWNDKVLKLRKIVRYMVKKKKVPAIINLTNSKKVVVKFNDKF